MGNIDIFRNGSITFRNEPQCFCNIFVTPATFCNRSITLL